MNRLAALAIAGALACVPAAHAQDKAKTATPAATPAAAPATAPAAAPAKAAETAKAPNSQQERMKMCNEKATGKTGDDRKKFMSSCLSGEEMKMSQQDKMKMCNAKAGPMKGDERKKFMSSCLSG
jgi:hypothetical protein